MILLCLQFISRLVKPDGSKEIGVGVKFSLDWQAYTRFFDFDTDLCKTAMCDAIAREPWSKAFFDNLKK